MICPDGSVTLPLHEVPSAPPQDALHDAAPLVCQLTVKGAPVTALAGAEIVAVRAAACWTVTVRGVALTAGGPVLFSPSQTKVNCDAPRNPDNGHRACLSFTETTAKCREMQDCLTAAICYNYRSR